MCSIPQYLNDLYKQHFQKFWSDCIGDEKIHEEYYLNLFKDSDLEDLKYLRTCLIQKAGSYNTREIGKLNAVNKLLQEKYPDWRNSES